MFCTDCGERNVDEARFCYKCGAPVRVPGVAPTGAISLPPDDSSIRDAAISSLKPEAEPRPSPAAEPVAPAAYSPANQSGGGVSIGSVNDFFVGDALFGGSRKAKWKRIRLAILLLLLAFVGMVAVGAVAASGPNRRLINSTFGYTAGRPVFGVLCISVLTWLVLRKRRPGTSLLLFAFGIAAFVAFGAFQAHQAVRRDESDRRALAILRGELQQIMGDHSVPASMHGATGSAGVDEVRFLVADIWEMRFTLASDTEALGRARLGLTETEWTASAFDREMGLIEQNRELVVESFRKQRARLSVDRAATINREDMRQIVAGSYRAFREALPGLQEKTLRVLDTQKAVLEFLKRTTGSYTWKGANILPRTESWREECLAVFKVADDAQKDYEEARTGALDGMAKQIEALTLQ